MAEIIVYVRMIDVEEYVAQGWVVFRLKGWKGHDRKGFRNFMAVYGLCE